MNDGMGGVRQALDNLGVEVTLYAAANLDSAASRVVSAAWPEVSLFGSAEDIDGTMLRKWLTNIALHNTIVTTPCVPSFF